MTPPPGGDGGLANAIAGSLIMVGSGTLIGTPVGILAGTYSPNTARRAGSLPVTRFINDVLLSAPSIVIGLFVYAVYVAQVGHFSGWAGSLGAGAASWCRWWCAPPTTCSSSCRTPCAKRRSRSAARRWKMITLVTYRAARAGMVTGILLAVARISGETAPLLFTALNNQFWSLDMNQPMANLPVVIFQFAMSPYEDWHRLAWGGAPLITLPRAGARTSRRASLSGEQACAARAHDRAAARAEPKLADPQPQLLLRRIPRAQEHQHATSPSSMVTAFIGPSGLRQVDSAAHAEPHVRALPGAAGRGRDHAWTARTCSARGRTCR